MSLIRRAASYLVNKFYGRRYQRFVDGLAMRGAASVFSEIYARNLWAGTESRSGAGSDLAYTENLRAKLPALFERFDIRTVFDAPCGDFNWMRLVPLRDGLTYVGADIVPALIEANEKRYGDAQHRFIVADICKDPLPAVDLLLCRDCLFHLSNEDVFRALENFVRSGTRYLLTSTHVNSGFQNSNIRTGEFRMMDLFSPPFALPRTVLDRIDDYKPPFPPREMCLWAREQVEAALRTQEEKSNAG